MFHCYETITTHHILCCLFNISLLLNAKSEYKLFVSPHRAQFLEKIIFSAASKGRCLQSCARASSFWQMNVGVLCAKHLVKLQTMRGLWILFIQQRLR